MCLTLAACGAMGKMEAQWTGYSRTCISGVSYLQFASGVTVEYTRDGRVKGCEV